MCFRWRGFWLNYAIRADQTDLNIGRGFSYPAFVCINTPTQMCVCYCCKQHLFLKTVQKVRKENGLCGKRELYRSFMMKGKHTHTHPHFPQPFDLLVKDFQLTLIARIVMAFLWMSHMHKATASAPNWSIGCSAFFRTCPVSSNNADWAPCPLM